jgi:hypothetical protein
VARIAGTRRSRGGADRGIFPGMRTPSGAGFRRLASIPAALLLGFTACIGSPTADPAMAEAINEIGNELGMLRDENAQLQFQVDSLRSALARQDTLLRQVANLSGVPITR